MSSAPVMFFQAAALRQRYLDDLAAAVVDSRISEAQRQWLELVVEPIRLARGAPSRPQMGGLSTAEGMWEVPGACTGLLLGSERPGDWTMFWYSPFTGLRTFTSRKWLMYALDGWLDLPPGKPPQWSVEWFASDPFEQLESMLIVGHAGRLERLSDQLLQLPSLRDLLDAPPSIGFADALGRVGQPLPERGHTQLDGFWNSAAPGQATRRQLAAQALADGFGYALLAACQRGELSEQQLFDLRTLLPGAAGLADGLTAGTLALLIASQPVPLAGVLVVSLPTAVWVYSAWGGLRRCATLGEHETYFAEAHNRQKLLACISAGHQSLVLNAGFVPLQAHWLAQGHFLRLADGCIAWQATNLKQALSKLVAPLSKACSAVDDAQDIRHLLDRSLAGLGGLGRWRDSADAGPAVSAVTQAVDALARDELGLQSWDVYELQALRQIDAMAALQPGVGACAQQLLNRYLALLDAPQMDSAQLWVLGDDNLTLNLVTLFLQRLSGYSPAHLPGDAQVLEGGAAVPAQQRIRSTLAPQLLDKVLGLAAISFGAAFDAQLRRGRRQSLRADGQQMLPARLAGGLLTGLLRQVLALEQRLARLKPANLSMLEQALRHPALSARSGFGQQAAEVYGLAVQYDVRQPVAPLNGGFVLQCSTSNLSTLLLWSPLSGLQEFDSDEQLHAAIGSDLGSPVSGAGWLWQVSEPARGQLAFAMSQPDAAKPVIQLVAIEDSFITHLQADETRRQCQDIAAAFQAALARRCSAEQLENAVSAAQAQDGLRVALQTLARAIELERFSSVLPGWMTAASVAELGQLAELLKHYYATHQPGLNFMSGLAGLQAHSREKLMLALARDFPAANLDPDLIPLSWVQYTAAPVAPGELPSALPAATKKVTGNLTDYAVNRLFAPPDATLTVDIAGGFAGETRMNVSYLERLVNQLDVAASYRNLLQQALSPHDAVYPQRLARFARQFPARLRLATWELHLRKLLSARAVAFIERILDMPDGLARQPLGASSVVLCPLQLRAGPGRPADVASGMYLIGSATPGDGPWVLLVLMVDALELREYADPAAVLTDLQHDATLAGLVVQRLAPAVRRLYDNGGFTEPHLPWSTEDSFGVPWSTPLPPTVLTQPLPGNACKYCFEATLTLVLAAAREHSVTRAENDRRAWRFLISLGADQLLAFLPGKLGLLVAAWQARSLASEALGALRERHWGQALAQFCAALTVLVSSRRDRLAKAPQPSETSVPDAVRPDPVQARLRQFEVQDVSISELEKEPLFSLYRDPLRNHLYAVVAGKLYRVRHEAGSWCIVWHEMAGPAIRQSQHGEWQLSLGLRGGGPVASRFESAMVGVNAEEIFTTQAEGLPEIRRLYPDRARRIAQAHFWACSYLRTALRNLQPQASNEALPAASIALLEEFFGVDGVAASLLARVKSSMSTLLDKFLEPSLSPFASKRFVVGTGRDGYEEVPAFTYDADPMQRIFIGDRFFTSLNVRLKPPPSGQNPFEQGAHFRTTVLLHEMSHVAHKSSDIAYIEAVAPYLDLIEDNGEYYSSAKRLIERYQRRTLSHLTPRDELFTNVTDGAGPRDLNKSDNGALPTVLRLTGTRTLDQARDVFLQDPRRRVAVMLANADTVALLATLLGRRLFTAPSG